MTAIESKLLQDQYARIAELEAENAELKKYYQVLLEMPLRVSDRKPTREQIAGLVKGLEWNKSLGIWRAYGASFDYSYGDDKLRLFIRDLRDNRTPNTLYPDFAELRAAAERHHRETILSLLNL